MNMNTCLVVLQKTKHDKQSLAHLIKQAEEATEAIRQKQRQRQRNAASTEGGLLHWVDGNMFIAACP